MKDPKPVEEIIFWLLVIVRTGVLVAIIWYGISEFRRWKNKNDS